MVDFEQIEDLDRPVSSRCVRPDAYDPRVPAQPKIYSLDDLNEAVGELLERLNTRPPALDRDARRQA